MDDSIPEISLDRYWRWVALPLFFFVMSFGIFVLFRVGGAQMAGTATVLSTIASLKERPTFFRERKIHAKLVAAEVSGPTPSAPPAAAKAP